jgi:L-ascorbate metabolism protein UlaG (beta-lactamase superfamily)
MCFGGFLFAYSCTTVNYGAQKIKIENSPQFKNGKFANPVLWNEPSIGEWISTSWDFLVTGNDRKPNYNLPKQEADLSNFHNTDSNQLNATWLGHSSILLNIDGFRIALDPVFEKSVSIVGPSRFNGDIPIDVTDLEYLDAIVISHDHYDHLNKATIQRLEPITKMFFVPLGVGQRLTDWKVSQAKIIELDWWDETTIGGRLTLAATPAQHFSGRSLLDRDKTLWASWVLKTDNHRVFFSGDSGYFEGFKQIGDTYGPFDITFLECGAYNEKWHYVHMYPEETVQAHIDLKGKVLHPIHWGTFDLSLHSWYDPMNRLAAAAQKENIDIATPIVGDSTVYHHYVPNNRWWDTQMAQLKN